MQIALIESEAFKIQPRQCANVRLIINDQNFPAMARLSLRFTIFYFGADALERINFSSTYLGSAINSVPSSTYSDGTGKNHFLAMGNSTTNRVPACPPRSRTDHDASKACTVTML
ncbi:MAG: hypothetical protein U5M23_08480 [Marinagarivorans sp.]|nr:hypothetical protein [Marinagarivorans sp.]